MTFVNIKTPSVRSPSDGETAWQPQRLGTYPRQRQIKEERRQLQIRYDTIGEFDVDSKAERDQLMMHFASEENTVRGL